MWLPNKVYFIINGNRTLIKIGRTSNIESRIITLRTKLKEDCLVCGAFNNLTHTQAVKIETALHHKFKVYNHHNEWFYREPIQDYIIMLKDKIEMPNGIRFMYDLENDKNISYYVGAKTYNANDIDWSNYDSTRIETSNKSQ